ncbi:hypothetical protein O181_064894 [Austropuccinia psidii MF-1]|uniref:Uncharacterized protein n=1 Tax=Austropuccinia psidii MF-1 TaxID=1389203 RepID=A0A9Q3EQ24_9BASI|nr:hypothetical protein [Austropuccinia psidii MF-1]
MLCAIESSDRFAKLPSNPTRWWSQGQLASNSSLNFLPHNFLPAVSGWWLDLPRRPCAPFDSALSQFPGSAPPAYSSIQDPQSSSNPKTP